eukprot:TRINITY_DN18926_c0_g1::TRINITY_DN18926_c0_g1_i1::g.1404::m.1404 TRINITY_DN18926_c0_g1::TRINITY_DN18926_c0_g1_i1::g.1404  ORF type:complete len:444 (-),score=77.97,sp/Q54PW5/DPH1_DICDI/61.35/1e-176,Diphthamide_syn/PF01866.12/1.2e-105 TRINITY_DN18926_c0_g1_i1:198-1478(-)
MTSESSCGCGNPTDGCATKTPEDEKMSLVKRQPASTAARARRLANQIPDEILNDPELNAAIALLPSNYNFEIHKTIWRIKKINSKCVALQFPEGLLVYSCIIADIITKFTGATPIVMGDVTYGACCIDDFTAMALGADIIVHYGHSCLVPVDQCRIPAMYVFVDIQIDLAHFVDMVKFNFQPHEKVAILSTIQFAASVQAARQELSTYFQACSIPQVKPLSPAEVLGCTSPKLNDCDVLVFLSDGRFHLEAAMIQNPNVKAYRYDPYSKVLSLEEYDHAAMFAMRKEAVRNAATANHFGVVLGTLGRQGNLAILTRVESLLKKSNKTYTIVLLSELSPQKISMFQHIDAWIQIACPRLSMDWGYSFPTPMLSPYEAELVLGTATWQDTYPMDFYAKEGGPWANYYAGDRTSVVKVAGDNSAESLSF